MLREALEPRPCRRVPHHVRLLAPRLGLLQVRQWVREPGQITTPPQTRSASPLEPR